MSSRPPLSRHRCPPFIRPVALASIVAAATVLLSAGPAAAARRFIAPYRVARAGDLYRIRSLRGVAAVRLVGYPRGRVNVRALRRRIKHGVVAISWAGHPMYAWAAIHGPALHGKHAHQSRRRHVGLMLIRSTPSRSTPPAPATPPWLSGPAFYVSPSGSDSNPGVQSAPWRTIGHAASADTTAGSTVVIESGSYGENVTLSHPGSAGSPITFAARPGTSVSVSSIDIAASHVAVRGLQIAGARGDCVTIEASLTDVTVAGNQINHCGGTGISFARPRASYTTNSLISGNTITDVGTASSSADDVDIYANYLTVQGNDLSGTPNDVFDAWGDHLAIRGNNIHDISNSHGNHNDGFQTWGGKGNPVTNLLFEQNRLANFSGSNAHGFMVSGSGNAHWTVRDNVFDNTGTNAMILGSSPSGDGQADINVYNNTFYGHSVAVNFYSSGSTGTLANNIFDGEGPSISGGAQIREGYNDYYATGSRSGPGDMSANPNLANPAAGDFRETASSPTINAGDGGAFDPVRPYDFSGGSVAGRVDIGAYEYH
jgi:hypothetical protein